MQQQMQLSEESAAYTYDFTYDSVYNLMSNVSRKLILAEM
jgi:hypothetical protein